MKYGPLTNDIVKNSNESVLVDFQQKGAPLAICFGFYNPAGESTFDFYGRLKKLEMLSGRKINKILLRDKKNKWFHYGIEGLGDNIMEATHSLNYMIEELAPSHVFTIGQSMGGYGAVIFGALLQADRVLAFGPLSCFDSKTLELVSDYRWMPVVKEVEANLPKFFANDLVQLIKDNPVRVELFYGTLAGGGVNSPEAANQDIAHIARFHASPHAYIYPFHAGDHAITEFLRRNNVLDDLLLNRVLGTKLPEYSMKNSEIVDDSWMGWLEENILTDARPESLCVEMVKKDIAPETARKAMEYVSARIAMTKYFGQNGR